MAIASYPSAHSYDNVFTLLSSANIRQSVEAGDSGHDNEVSLPTTLATTTSSVSALLVDKDLQSQGSKYTTAAITAAPSPAEGLQEEMRQHAHKYLKDFRGGIRCTDGHY
ncbi:hypothetical protein PG993_008019 [Apiospora rasikravindrae]|uniref:Uncharacterized protein n=1 Tax=Apiospora rasikravindrae TaxID=990691 RepID=A0ABR1SZ53_9PEZI